MKPSIEKQILRDYPLALVTSLGVGGPADFFFKPASIAEIRLALEFAAAKDLPVTVIGYGTNLLVRDNGVRGLVIQLTDNLAAASQNGDHIEAQSGCLLSSISKLAAHHSLSGLEFAVGIPGSLGGALYMNAGAYDGEIGPLVQEVTWVTAEKSGRWTAEEFSYSYRHSRAQEENVVIAAAILKLTPGTRADILARMRELQEQRYLKQPLEFPSAGSTFKRPKGHYVGPMIEQAGLKGYQIGGAQVSEKHAGFIINRGSATATDVLLLIEHIQNVIQREFGVSLEPEIRIIGQP